MFINDYPDTSDGEADVIAFCPERQIVIMTDDRVLPLSGYVDDEGDSIEELEDAWAIIAGSDQVGYFIMCPIGEFQPRHLS